MSEKKVSIEVDVKIDSARSQVESLSKSINTKLKDKKINLKVDTRQVTQSFTGMANNANKTANKMAQAFAKAFDANGKSIKNINKSINNVLANTSKTAKSNGAKAAKNFANAFNFNIDKNVKAVNIKINIEDAVDQAADAGMDAGLMFAAKFVKAVKGLSKIVGKIFKTIGSTIKKAITSAIQGAVRIAKNTLTGLTRSIGSIFEKTYRFTIEANAEESEGGSSSSTSSSLLNAGMLATSLKAITAAAAQNSMPKELGNVTARLADRLITAGQNALTFGKFAYQAYVMIRSNWPKIISTLSSIGEAVLPHIKSAMRDAGRAIAEVTKSSLIPGIKKILSAASEKFQEAVEKMCNSTNPYVRAMGYALKMLVKITEGCKLLVKAGKKVIDALEWIGDKVVKVFTGLFSTLEWIGDKVVKVFTGVFSTLEHIGNGIVGFGKIIWQATTDLPGALAKLTDAISSACKTIASKVKEAFMGLKDRIKNWWNGTDSSSGSSSSSNSASAGGVKGGSATGSRDTFNWSSDAQKDYNDYLNNMASGFATFSKNLEGTKVYFDSLNQSVSGSSISLDEMIKSLRNGNRGALRENTIKDITSYFSSISAESFDYSQLEEPTKRIINRMADMLIQFADKYERLSRGSGSSYSGSKSSYSSSNVEKPKGKYGIDWAKEETKVEVEVEPEKKSLKGITEKIKKAVKSVGKSKVDVDVDSTKVDKLKNKVQEVEKAAGDTAEESFVDKIKSIDDAIMAYAKFENSVNAVLHPVKTLKQELMKKIAFGTLEDLGEKSKELKKRFDDLKQSVKALKNMDAGQEKTAASLKVLGDSAKLAVSKLKLVLKANTVGKLIEKMKGPADKATKELAEKVPGGKDNINLFKGAISKLGLLFGGIGLFGITKEATNQAIKYEAALGQLNRRLGESASVLDRFASSKGLDLGLSRSQVAEYGNIFSVYVSQFESDAQTVADTTQSLLEAAAKTAQATGYDLTTVMDSFRSGLTGSTEAVDQYGLNLKVANLELSESFKQVANGVDSWDKLTTAQQQQIIAMEMIAQTNKNFGDGVKNTNTLMLRFQAVLSNVKLALGNTFKVILTAVLPPLTALLQTLEVVLNHVSQFVSSLLSLMGVEVSFDNAFGNIDASNVSDAGDSVDAIGDSADKATENAKKLKGELAGFDEINKITMQQDSSAESPSVGGMEIADMTIGEIDTKPAENKIQEFAQKVKDIFESIGGAFMEGWDVNLPYINESLENLKAAFGRLRESASNLFQSIWDNGGEQLITNIGRLSSAVVGLAIDLSGQIANALAGVFDHLDPSNNPAMQYFLDSLNGMVLKAEECILAIGGHFASFMEHGGQEFINNLADIGVAMGGLVAELTGEVFEAITKFMDHLDPANNPGTQKFLDSLNTLAQKVEEFIMSIGGWFSKFMDYGGQAFLNNLGDIALAIGRLASELLGDVIGAVTTFMNSWAGDMLINAVATALEWVSGAIEAVITFLADHPGIVETFLGAWGLYEGGKKVLDWYNNISIFAGGIADLIKGIVGSDIIGKLKTFFATFDLKSTISSATTAISGFLGQMKAFAAASFTNGINAVKQMATNIATLTKNLILSTAEVIKNIAQWALQKAAMVASKIATGLMTAAQTALNVVMNMNPIGLIITAIAALVAGIVLAYNKCEWFRDLVDKVWAFIKDVFGGIGDWFAEKGKAAWEGLKNAWSNYKEWWSDRWEDAKSAFSNMGEWFADKGSKAWEGIKGAWSNTKSWWSERAEDMTSAFEKASPVLETIGENALKAITNPFETIGDIFGGVVDIVKRSIENIKDALDFDWEWPDIKLPHFSIRPSGWKIGDLLEGSIPSLGIDWYSNGGIFNSRTLIGIGDANNGIGNSPEAVVPLDSMYKNITNIVRNEINKSIGSHVNQSQGNTPVILRVNDVDLAKTVIKSINDLQRSTGEVLLDI